jgi:hypothetical protein
MRLNLKAIVKRLIRRPKRQPITRRLHEIQRLGLQRALELADELILCIATVAGRGADVGNIVAWFGPSAFWTDFQDGSGAVVAKDMEAFGRGVVVVFACC